jgi:hypothetical protein
MKLSIFKIVTKATESMIEYKNEANRLKREKNWDIFYKSLDQNNINTLTSLHAYKG